MDKPTIIIIGMRGAGKSTLGRIGAESMGFNFFDMDELLEQEKGCSCAEIIESHGWDGFREMETISLTKTLVHNPRNTVVSCGGGIVETKSARSILKSHSGPVIHVQKNIEDIVFALSTVPSGKTNREQKIECCEAESLSRRPSYLESIETVWNRRMPFFEECSTHCFFVSRGDDNWNRLSHEFKTFLVSIFQAPLPLVLEPLCVLGNCSAAKIDSLKNFSFGFDAVVLTGPISPEIVAKVSRETSVPVILDCGNDVNLVVLASIFCIPYVKTTSLNAIRLAMDSLKGKWAYTTKAILDMNFQLKLENNDTNEVNHAEVIESQIVEMVTLVNDTPSCCYVNVRNLSGEKIDNIRRNIRPGVSVGLHHEPSTTTDKWLKEVLQHGPVFLSLNEDQISMASFRDGLLEQYCLFGHPIRSSPSPSLHNAGFAVLGLPKKYTLCDTLDREKIRSVLSSSSFRGASVTIPHKETIIEFMGSLSDAARMIGAVNTVIKDPLTGHLRGENTDWWGIFNLVKDHVGNVDPNNDPGCAIVVGAGGTAMAACYCVIKLGLRLVVFNRTAEKACTIAKRFDGKAVTNFNDIRQLKMIIGTVPASSQFQLPNDSLLLQYKPVVVDAAYRPRRTALLQQASRCGCLTFEGIDMLIEQGKRQMELWTGINNPPSETMSAAARRFYDITG